MSNPKDEAELFTELEEALRGVYCAIAVLEKLVELSGEDAPIYDLLASHLDLSYQRASQAFSDLHGSYVRRRADQGDAP